MENNSPAQGTPEWFALRRGLFTGSEIENICKPKGLGATGETYIYQKVAEILTSPEFDTHFENEATRWGNEYEPLAAHVHGKRSDLTTEDIGFQVHYLYKFLGASPDRKVYDKGAIGISEYKCPFNGENHIKHMMIDSVDYLKSNFAKYYWQMVCEFVCTKDATFVDFVSFDPRMGRKYGYFRFRFVPSEEDCTFLISRAIEAEKKKQEILTKIGYQQ